MSDIDNYNLFCFFALQNKLQSEEIECSCRKLLDEEMKQEDA